MSSSSSSSSSTPSTPTSSSTDASPAVSPTGKTKPMPVNLCGANLNVGFPLLACACSNDGFVLCGGGGGSAKTGIRNALILFRLNENNELKQTASLDVGADAINSIAIHPKRRICAFGAGKWCRVTSFENDTFDEITKFQSDFHDAASESEQRLVMFSLDGSQIVTAGADGVVRQWAVSLDDRKSRAITQWAQDASPKSPPQGVAYVNGSKASLVAVITDRQLALHKAGAASAVATAAAPDNTRFRGCCALGDGTVLTGCMRPASRKLAGDSTLTRWALGGKGDRLDVLAARQVSREHHVSMGVSADGELVALGSGSGDIVVCQTSTLRAAMRCARAHSFVVTQVAFGKNPKSQAPVVVSVSLDHTIVVTPVIGNVRDYRPFLLAALLVIVLFVLFQFTGAMRAAAPSLQTTK